VAVVAEEEARARELAGHRDVDSILERELAGAAAARAREVTEEVDAALARLDAGTYGICESCLAPIPGEPLAAIPHARLGVECPRGRRACSAGPLPGPPADKGAQPVGSTSTLAWWVRPEPRSASTPPSSASPTVPVMTGPTSTAPEANVAMAPRKSWWL